VPVISRKNPTRDADGASRGVLGMAAQMAPIAGTASTACRQGAEGASRWAAPRVQAARSWAEPQLQAAQAWAEPQVQAARSWAAPRVEQAGLAVRDKIGPSLSSALVEASHRLDGTPPQPQRPRRWPQLVAGIAILAAAAGSAVAAVMLKRQAEAILGPDDADAADGPEPMPGWADGATRATGDGPASQRPVPPEQPGEPRPGPDDFLP
jgi:hypothetical protein